MTEKTKKALKLPEAGQWPDRIAPTVLVAGAVLSTIGFLLAFLWASPVNGAAVNGVEMIGGQMVTSVLLLSQKIFYFHMPVAITSFIALAFAGYYAVRFLMTKNRRFDTCSKIAMEIALLFVACTMITGDLWTRFEWGVWWTWDPRLTTYLILMLIIIAYFILRNAIDEPERRATYGAVLSIIALIDVPICFMVTRLIPSSIHPVVVREGGMSADMHHAHVLPRRHHADRVRPVPLPLPPGSPDRACRSAEGAVGRLRVRRSANGETGRSRAPWRFSLTLVDLRDDDGGRGSRGE